MSGTEQAGGDLDEAFFVMDSLDSLDMGTVSEEDEDTLEMISQQTSEDSDSGLESSDEDYRNFKIFG